MTPAQWVIIYITGTMVTFCLYGAVGIRRFSQDIAKLAAQRETSTHVHRPFIDVLSLSALWPMGIIILGLYLWVRNILDDPAR